MTRTITALFDTIDAAEKAAYDLASTALAEKLFPVIRPWFCDIDTK
jgi:hypothetical protein